MGLPRAGLLKIKDYPFYFAIYPQPAKCLGEMDTVPSDQLRSGPLPPAGWEHNEELDRIAARLKQAKGAYPAVVSACTSLWRVITHLGSATATLLVVTALLFDRRRVPIRNGRP